MSLTLSKTIWGITLLIIFGALAETTVADDNGKRHQHREGRHNDDNGAKHKNLKPVSNAAYTNSCGACHFAYQPELLPVGSWGKILGGIDDHFGEAVDLDPDARSEIDDYLSSNAANTSSAELSRKIFESLGGETPSRITDIPYIRKEHHELSAQVVKRPSVGSWSNCIACHRTAENGVYDDDRVSIPE